MSPLTKSRLKFIATNTVFLVALVFGTVYGVEGAARVAMFIAWLAILAYGALYSTRAARRYIQEHPQPTVPTAIGVAVDVVALGLMVWYGWALTGCCYMLFKVGGSNYVRHLREADQHGAQAAQAGAKGQGA